MKIKTQGNTVLVRETQDTFTNLCNKLLEQEHLFEGHHLIIDLSHRTNISSQDLLCFDKVVSFQKENRKSFVLVMPAGFDFNEDLHQINIVPTLQEAHDIIEIEEIERDLGF